MADIAPAADLGGIEILTLDDAPGAQSAPAPDIAEMPDDDAAQALPRSARLQPDGSVMLTFRFPVTLRYRAPGVEAVKEQEFHDLHFRRLTGKDMRAMQAAEAEDRMVVAIARSTGVKPSLMELLYDRMDATDATAALEVLSFFIGSGQKTGH